MMVNTTIAPMNYQEALKQLDNTISKESKDYMHAKKEHEWFLERTQRFFDRLQNPEKHFSYIHIAGSSGKGSTAIMTYTACVRAKKNVGVYMNPYVSVPTENIGIRGKLVDQDIFAEATAEIIPVVHQIEAEEPEWRPSYAEIFFAIAMRCFTKEEVSLIVLETGCGGRFDKTNIIPAPLVSILTPLTYDHTDILGDTLESIAWHKAGIIKKGSTVVSTVTEPALQKVFNTEAKKQDVTIKYVSPQKKYTTAMIGQHQQINAAGVDAALSFLGIDQAAIDSGIAEARLPARVEMMPQKKNEPLVLIDGAHSPQKMDALVFAIKNDSHIQKRSKKRKIHLLFAAKETKSVDALLAPLSSIVDTAIMTTFVLPGFQSHDATHCATTLAALSADIPIMVEENPLTAFEKIVSYADSDDLIVVTGSLYIVGIIREKWYGKKEIVDQRTPFPI